MKIISLWEPWATAMAIGVKRIETRSWKTDYRGWLAIHASKGGLSTRDFRATMAQPFMQEALGDTPLSPGHIVAVVMLIDCCPTATVFSQNHYPSYGLKLERALGDYSEGRWAWVTDSRTFRLSQPIPYRAHQGLYDLDGQTVQLCRQQWKAANAREYERIP